MGNRGFINPLFETFDEAHFSDIFFPIWAAALILLVACVVLYNIQARRLHRHEPLRTLQEWLLWTGLSTFGLILVGSLFHFYFLFVFSFIVIGCATFIWVRFFRFPPLIRVYNDQLRRARFMSQARYKQAEATVRTKRSRGGQRRRRR